MLVCTRGVPADDLRGIVVELRFELRRLPLRELGDIIAIVISDDRATGADAAELVSVDYDPLPAVVSPREAAKDEMLLFPEAGTNVAARSGSPEHDEKLFAECDVTRAVASSTSKTWSRATSTGGAARRRSTPSTRRCQKT